MKKEKRSELGYAVAKGLVGSLPIAGALASEILAVLVSSPLEKRRDEWMTEVGERLRLLEEEKVIVMENLSSNEEFINVVVTASSLAIKTSNNLKKDAFRNAILNTAINSSNEVYNHIFLQLLDAFTDVHIQLIALFRDPNEYFTRNKIHFSTGFSSTLHQVIKTAYPSLEIEQALLNIIWADLKRSGLINSGDLSTMMTGSGVLNPILTETGERFLNFIQNPD